MFIENIDVCVEML